MKFEERRGKFIPVFFLTAPVRGAENRSFLTRRHASRRTLWGEKAGMQIAMYSAPSSPGVLY